MKRRREPARTNPGELLKKAAVALTLPATAKIWQDLVSLLGTSLTVDWAFLAEIKPGEKPIAQTLAAWHRGNLIPTVEYPFERLPEDDPFSRDICWYPSAAHKRLPNAWLKQVRAEGFGRASLFDSLGRLRGLLVIAHSQPLQGLDRIEALVRIIAFRAAADLERLLPDEHFYKELLEDARVSRPRESRLP